MATFKRSWVPEATDAQWERVRRMLEDARPGAVFEPAQLRSATGIHLSDANALIEALCNAGLARAETIVFHDCAEHSVARFSLRPSSRECVETLSNGWVCPECEETTEQDELRTEFGCVFTDVVPFVRP